jgi:nucleotide-sensitive chloride channel 1A
MPPTTIRSAPALDSFTPLAEHQSQTPTTFYGAKPVLHYHGVGVRALAFRNQLSKLPIFASTEPAAADGEGATTVEVVDTYINSEYVPFSPVLSLTANRLHFCCSPD